MKAARVYAHPAVCRPGRFEAVERRTGRVMVVEGARVRLLSPREALRRYAAGRRGRAS